MKRLAIAALLTAGFVLPAAAQKMPQKASAQIVAEGEIISSGPVGNNGASRAHEVFAIFRGGIYYCLLNGAANPDHTPYAECFGPPIGRD